LIPLYISRKLVPARTIVSFESMIIWFVLAGLVLVNIAGFQLIFRSTIFLPSFLFVALAFFKLLKPNIRSI
jgi:hypothetical protein